MKKNLKKVILQHMLKKKILKKINEEEINKKLMIIFN